MSAATQLSRISASRRFGARYEIWCCFLLAIAVVRLWILPLHTGLWLDETGTYWVIRDGWSEIISRCIIWPAQNILYSFIACLALQIGGAREWVLRLPSILATALSAYLLYRLGVRLLNKPAALAAVIVFSCSEAVAFAAADARSYAMGVTAAIASMYALVRWMDHGRLRDGLVYALLAGLTFDLHYIYITVLAVHAAYGLYRLRRGAPIKARDIAVVIAAIGIVMLPLAAHLATSVQHGADRSFAGTPGLSDLFFTLFPPVLLGGLACGVLLARVCLPDFEIRPLAASPPARLLIVLWAVIPCVLLFAVSLMTNFKVFIPRYLLVIAPAISLFAGWLVACLQPVRSIVPVALMFVVCSVLSSVGLRNTSHGGDWRAAMAAVRSVAGASDMPVLVRSGFVESKNFDWLGDETRKSFLFAPFSIYPPPGTVIPLPYTFNRRVVPYLEEAAGATLERASRFALLTSGDGAYENWLSGRLYRMGFEVEKRLAFGGRSDTLRLLIFQRGPLAAARDSR